MPSNSLLPAKRCNICALLRWTLTQFLVSEKVSPKFEDFFTFTFVGNWLRRWRIVKLTLIGYTKHNLSDPFLFSTITKLLTLSVAPSTHEITLIFLSVFNFCCSWGRIQLIYPTVWCTHSPLAQPNPVNTSLYCSRIDFSSVTLCTSTELLGDTQVPKRSINSSSRRSKSLPHFV